ncbi:PH domain-containing protein [Streptomyces sp. NPDC057705]|uniref:PH domain-containing protein n=1 Tax=Streptomyces sp. NPDC057705 TaxID=3346222 RepID=UPI0036784F3A
MSEAMRPREYRRGRQDWRLHAVIVIGAGALCLKLQDGPWSGEVKALLTGLTVFLTALGGYSLRFRFTTVDDQGITTGTWCRVRRLPWDGIHDIRTVAVAESLPGPRTLTYAYRSDGRRVLLSCVDDDDLPVLDLEVAVLRSLLRERRRADWAPDPRAEPRIARQMARERRMDRFFLWMTGWRGLVVIFASAVLLLAGIIVYENLFGGS